MPRGAQPFVPAIAVSLAEVGWRVASRILGIVPERGSMLVPSEWRPPWMAAAVVVGLAGWLLARPGAGPALALAAVQLARLVLTALPLVLLAAERLAGWGIFDPAHPAEPWATEVLHALLQAAAALLLATGYRRHRKARREEWAASVADVF